MKTYNTKRKALQALKPGHLVYKADHIDKHGRPTGHHYYIVGTWAEAHEFVSGRPLQEIRR